MRISRLNLVVVAIAGIALVAVLATVRFASRDDRPVNGFRLVTARAQYRRDLQTRGEQIPPSITLDTLVISGHLRREETKAFEAVIVALHADADEKRPQSILAEARMRDGTWNVVMGDGSVQQMTPARYSETRRAIGQPASGAKGKQL